MSYYHITVRERQCYTNTYSVQANSYREVLDKYLRSEVQCVQHIVDEEYNELPAILSITKVSSTGKGENNVA